MRHASTTLKKRTSGHPPQSAKSKTAVSTASSSPFKAPIPEVRAKLNPPPETLAPDLTIPERKQEGFVKYVYRCGKIYIAFYKQGIKNTWGTLKLAKRLRAKQEKAPQKERDTVLTRAEWQIVRRSKLDRLRVPAFGVLLIIFGEWLPLLALYITPIIPEACRIPSQVERAQRKHEKKRQERERRLALDAARLVSKDRKPGQTSLADIRPQTMSLDELEKTDLYTLLSLSTRFDCHTKIWDWMFLTPPPSLLRWSLKNKLRYLQQDDKLIRRDGGYQALGGSEVERACVERGIKVLGRKEHDLRRDLAGWFETS